MVSKIGYSNLTLLVVADIHRLFAGELEGRYRSEDAYGVLVT